MEVLLSREKVGREVGARFLDNGTGVDQARGQGEAAEQETSPEHLLLLLLYVRDSKEGARKRASYTLRFPNEGQTAVKTTYIERRARREYDCLSHDYPYPTSRSKSRKMFSFITSEHTTVCTVSRVTQCHLSRFLQGRAVNMLQSAARILRCSYPMRTG